MPLMLMVPDHKYSIIQMVSMIEILLFRSWSRFHKSWVHVINHLRPMPTPKIYTTKSFSKVWHRARKIGVAGKTVYEIDPWLYCSLP